VAKYDSVNIDDISNQGAEVADGHYVVRYSSYKPLTSKAASLPMVVITFDVLEGSFEGFEVDDLSVLNSFVDKKGTKRYFAVEKWKKQMAAIGKPFAKGFAFPLDGEAAGKMLAKALKGLRLLAEVKSEVSKKDQKTYRRLIISGLAPDAVAEDVEELDEEFMGEEFEDEE
jgi:hypothetical protein